MRIMYGEPLGCIPEPSCKSDYISDLVAIDTLRQ
jgi:hypothetical protein